RRHAPRPDRPAHRRQRGDHRRPRARRAHRAPGRRLPQRRRPGARGGTMNLSAWSIRNPIPAAMLFVLLTLAGLLSFRAMKVQNFPDMDLPVVMVTASLPGAAPGQLESDVARKIENAVATLQGLKHITTTLTDGAV